MSFTFKRSSVNSDWNTQVHLNKHILYFLCNSDDNHQDKLWNLKESLPTVTHKTLQNMLEGGFVGGHGPSFSWAPHCAVLVASLLGRNSKGIPVKD